MTALAWDQLGERRFETGIDRGVLYPMDETPAQAWNGLLSVAEEKGREIKSYYVDGIKYLDHHVIGAFSGKLQAYTYPEKLDELTGTAIFAPGVHLYDQVSRPFHLSYRTLIGNDLDSTDHGYKIHMIYNVMASPGVVTYATIGTEIVPNVFEWALTATPPQVWGIRPTAHVALHVALDTSTMDPDLLSEIEALLYGTDEDEPAFPNLEDLLAMIEGT